MFGSVIGRENEECIISFGEFAKCDGLMLSLEQFATLEAENEQFIIFDDDADDAHSAFEEVATGIFGDINRLSKAEVTEEILVSILVSILVLI